SIKGKGSRFTIALPLGHAHLQVDEMVQNPTPYFPTEAFIFDPLADTEDSAVLPKNAADQQLLIIEDNAELQFFLKRKLNVLYQITSATDGDAGLQQAFDMVPDLIICDIELPNRNGLDIVRTLKSDLRTSHIPIILLTARSTVEQQIEGTMTGADAYITKPFNIQYLQEIIRNLLHNRQILKDNFGKGLLVFSEGNQPEQLEEDVNTLDRAFIQKFTNYIDAHYARQDFQVTDLCQEMNLSRSQLYRKIKALFGESISDYIQQVRLEKARNLLLEGKLSVAEIAYQVGYSSPDYFSTVFRSKYNVAPSQIRKQG
ncbi:MAG: helix-turn-helix domain-containing protein, partial [Bacteroidota bacterium]